MKLKFTKHLLLTSLIICFSLVAQAQISISGFNPKSGDPGTLVTITGMGFDATTSNNVVYFGEHLALVNSAGSSKLTVTVPIGASYSRLLVINTSSKLQAATSLYFNPTFLSNRVFDAYSVNSNSQRTLLSPNTIFALEPLDLNNDKYPDVVASASYLDSLYIISNTTTNVSTVVSFNPNITQIPNLFNSGASAMAKGDLDGDGKLDLVVANSANSTISIYRNNGSNVISASTFDPPFTISGTDGVTNIYVEDMNSDGKPEIIFNNGNYPIYIIQNTFSGSNISAGSFGNKTFADVNVNKFQIADLNNDGKPDLILYSGGSIQVVKNNIPTNGIINLSSFGAPSTYNLSPSYGDIACGDLNNDGKIDFAITDISIYQTFVFQNNTTVSSNITFSTSSFSTDYPQMISISDLDGDAKPDFVISNQYGSSVLVKNSIIGNSITGNSFSKSCQTNNNGHYAQKIADFDNDGKPDIGYISSFHDYGLGADIYYLEVFKNTFDTYPVIDGVSPSVVQRDDVISITGIYFDNSITEIRFGTFSANYQVVNANLIIATVPGNAISNYLQLITPIVYTNFSAFTLKLTPVINSFSPLSAKPGDRIIINGKNFNPFKPDLNVVYFGEARGTVISATNTRLEVKVPNDAGAGFIQYTNADSDNGQYFTCYSSGYFFPTYPGSGNTITGSSFAVSSYKLSGADGYYSTLSKSSYNNYGALDIFMLSKDSVSTNSFLNVWYNNSDVHTPTGNNLVTDYSQIYPSYAGVVPNDLKVADFDTDGTPDIAYSDYSTVHFYGANYGSYTDRSEIYEGQSRIAFGDIDSDGIVDMIGLDQSNSKVINIYKNTFTRTVYYQTFYGSYLQKVGTITVPGVSGLSDIELADMDGDHKPDIMVTDGSNYKLIVYKNSISATTFDGSSFSQVANIYTNVYGGKLDVADFDKDGKPEVLITTGYTIGYSNLLFKNNSSPGTISLATIAGFTGSGGYSYISAVGDIDGDAQLDIINSQSSTTKISIFKNTGTLSTIFSNKTDISIPDPINSMVVNDLDGDWRPEIILTSSFGSHDLTILKNNIPGQTYVPVDSIKATAKSGQTVLSLLGASLPLDIQIFPSDASDKSWKFNLVSPPGIAMLDTNGNFSASTNGIYKVELISTAFGPYRNQFIEITVTGQNLFITSISSRTGVPGSLLSIVGNHFNTNPDSNYVLIGDVKADVLYADPSNLQVRIPDGARFGLPSVTNGEIQASALSPTPFFPTFNGGATIDTSLLKKTTVLDSRNAISMASADLDGDGYTDLVVLNDTSFTIFRNTSGTNQGVLSFAGTIIPTNRHLISLHIQDIDLDGKPDILIGAQNIMYSDYEISTYFNNSRSGNLSGADFEYDYITIYSRPVFLNSLDMDDDGYIDIVMIDDNSDFTSYTSNPALQGGGRSNRNGFNEINSVPLGYFVPSSIDFADLNGDGIEELIISQSADTNMYTISKGGLIGGGKQQCKGCKSAIANPTYIQLKYASDLVRIVDIDGDNHPDILSLNYANKNLSVLRNTTGNPDSLSFKEVASLTFTGVPYRMDVGDINGDNSPEISVTDSAGFVHIFQNKSSVGTVSLSRKSISVDFGPQFPLIVDLDNDQKPDIAVSNPRTGRIEIFKNAMPGFGSIDAIIVNSIDNTSILSPNVAHLQMKATVLPLGVDSSVVWSLSHSIASGDFTTISNTGLVELNSTTINGIITVIGTSVSNPLVSGYFVITVIGKTKPASDVIVSNENLTISGVKASPCLANYELSVPIIAGQTYQWYYNGLKLVGANNNVYKPVVNGLYYLIAIDTIAYKYESYDVTLTGVNSPDLTNSGDTLLSTSLIADYYQWYVDNIVIKNATSQSLRIWYNGTYYVSTKNNSDGCKIKSPELPVKSKAFRSIKDSDLIFGDSTIENYGPAVGSLDVKIYPNPSTGIFSIEVLSEDEGNSYQITDLMGRTIETGEIPKSGSKYIANMNRRSLEKGLYFVYIKNKSQKKCLKLVIE